MPWLGARKFAADKPLRPTAAPNGALLNKLGGYRWACSSALAWDHRVKHGSSLSLRLQPLISLRVDDPYLYWCIT